VVGGATGDILRLHGEQDDRVVVDDRFLDGVHAHGVRAGGRVDRDAAAADRREVRTARDERDVLAGLREPRCRQPANRACAEDEKFHVRTTSPREARNAFASLMVCFPK
jgi:hypothetical protein